jgi:hypothetical protein
MEGRENLPQCGSALGGWAVAIGIAQRAGCRMMPFINKPKLKRVWPEGNV